MNECPVCKEIMVAFEYEGIEIDRCVDCKGTWLDHGEVELIAELAGAQPGKLTAALAATEKGNPTDRGCPRCSGNLEEITVTGKKKPVMVDRCPKGHGIWFDKGEVHGVIASFEEGEEGAVAKYLANLLHDEVPSPEKED